MNDNHSVDELSFKPRWISPALESAVQDHSVVVLTGARQVGKSTLLQHSKPFVRWRYLTLDDYDVRTQVDQDPQALWAGVDRLVLDEVQKAPGLIPAIKRAVDQRQRKMRFVLSGSANLLLMEKISESLAGRAIYLTLSPMTWGEMQGKPAPDWFRKLFSGDLPAEAALASHSASDDLAQLLLRGFMPPLLELARPEAWARWWEGYIMTYLERDLRQLARIEALADFRRVMSALALRSGQLLNQTEVARDAAVPQPTVHRYINLLEAGHLVERLPAYAVSRTTRLIKTPKAYWMDPALAVHLAGYSDLTGIKGARELGGFFETLVLHHLRVASQGFFPRPRLHYWRTASGSEVDFVLEQGRSLVVAEVKMATTARYTDVEGLRRFLREYPQTKAGLLIYTGREVRRLDEQIVAVPWQMIAAKLP